VRLKPAIEVDEELWPLVTIRYHGPRSEADWEAMFATYARMHARRERFVTINDTTNSTLPSALERALIGKYAKEYEVASKRDLVATCMVIESTVMRGVLTAIHWVYHPGYKFFVCGTMREAYATTARQLRAEGIPIHPGHASLLV
jgi:hypothetical protein